MQNEHDTYIKPTTTDVDIYISKKNMEKPKNKMRAQQCPIIGV